MKKRWMAVVLAVCVMAGSILSPTDGNAVWAAENKGNVTTESKDRTEGTENMQQSLKLAETKMPENPVYNEKTEATKWSYVYFGRYPQSEVTGDELTAGIINANYNKNGDAVVNGVKYRRLNKGSDNKPEWRYFRYEPIKWKVLRNDGNSLLLLSDQGLFNEYTQNEKEYSSSETRSILNGYNELENQQHKDYSDKGTNFCSMAFYEAEQDVMEIQSLDEEGTNDLVMLPTRAVLYDKAYGFGSDYTRKIEVTDYQNSLVFYNKWYYLDINEWGDIDWAYYYTVCPQIKINIASNLWSMECPAPSFQAKSLESGSVNVSLSTKSYTYDGKAKEPKITVKDGAETLIQDVDYTVAYQNNVQAGTTAAVRIIGTGDYVGSKTVYFTINKAKQSISVQKKITKNSTDSKFKIGARITAGDGSLSYKSSNQSVAKIDKYGNITICGGGTATLTVTAKETANYREASVNVTLTVKKNTKSLTVKKTQYTKTYGDKAFKLEIKAPEKASLSFKSDNKNVVTVDRTGKVAIKGCGKATITVSMRATSKYSAAKKTVTVTVKPKKSKFASVSSKKKGQVTLKWKKDSKASGYEISYTINGKSKKIDIKKNSTTSATIKKLKSKKTCSIKIRAYKIVKGKKIYGDYSAAKKIKVK